MRNLFITIIIAVFISSCTTVKNSNKTNFPKTFDEAEAWFDSIHNKPITLDGAYYMEKDSVRMEKDSSLSSQK